MTARPLDPDAARAFAAEVVDRLRAAGHETYWAGGCVRDELLGRVPADYDVATAAEPHNVRAVFGQRRTLAVGAAFGVITVLGPRGQGATLPEHCPHIVRLRRSGHVVIRGHTA